MPISNAFRNIELANRDQDLKEHGDYGVVNYDIWNYYQSSVNMSTSYAVLSGSARSYTPKYSDSVILYRVNFHVAYHDAYGIGHFRIYRNGSYQANYDQTCGGENYMQYRTTMIYHTNSWGAGTAHTIDVRGRDYSASNEFRYGTTQHWDGAGTDRRQRLVGEIIEFRNPPTALLDFGA